MKQQPVNRSGASNTKINEIERHMLNVNQKETKERFISRPSIGRDSTSLTNVIPMKDNNISSTSIHSRDSIDINGLKQSPYGNLTLSGEDERWRAHRIAEDYMDLVGNMMYPATYLSQFGYDPVTGQHPTERTTTLGLITSSMRRPTVVERWSPYEISIFESTIALYGKDFHTTLGLIT